MTGCVISNHLLPPSFLGISVDAVSQVLLALPQAARKTLHSTALETAAGYERALKLRLLKINMQNAGLEIKSPKQQGLQGAGLGDAMEIGEIAGVGGMAGGRALRTRGKLGFGR